MSSGACFTSSGAGFVKRLARQRDHEEERGFALLIVFLMAAAVAFTLYQQIPRVAFESQRDKEELLIERGQQYQRAIQLYFVAYQKYPAKIEDLENTNDKRYLRRRYIDPMTGKDEWRLIHVNAAGQFTDSLVKKPPAAPASASSTQTLGAGSTTTASTGAMPATGSNSGSGAGPNAPTPSSTNPAAQAPQTPNAAVLRRPSDRIPGSGTSAPAVDPNDPSTWPPIALFPQTGNQQNGQPGQPGASPKAGLVPGSPQFGQQIQGQQIQGLAGQQLPGQGFPGQAQFQPQPFQIPSTQGQQFTGQQFPGQQFPGQQFPGQQFPGQAAVPGTTVLNPQGNPVTVGPDGQLIPVTNPPGQTGNPQAGVTQFGVNQGGLAQGGPTPGGITPLGGTSPPQAGGFGFGGAPGAAGTTPSPFGAAGAAGAPNAALGLIGNMLTNPSTAPNMPGTANMGAGGMAGVASTFKGSSIKVYKERSKYEEWEFIYELNNNNAPGQQTPANPSQPGTTQTSPSPFGLPQPGLSQPGFPQQ